MPSSLLFTVQLLLRSYIFKFLEKGISNPSSSSYYTTYRRFSNESLASGKAEQQLHAAPAALLHGLSFFKVAKSMLSLCRAERSDSCWVVKSLALFLWDGKTQGGEGWKKWGATKTNSYTMIHSESMRSLRKLHSFVSHFLWARKTLILRRAKSSGAVGGFTPHLAFPCWMYWRK